MKKEDIYSEKKTCGSPMLNNATHVRTVQI